MTCVIIFTVALIVGSLSVLGYMEYKKRWSGDKRRNMDFAMLQLNRQISRNPNDAAAYTKRGVIRQKKGDVKGAMADIRKALEVNPSHTEARYYHGLLLQQLGELSAAGKEYEWIVMNSEDPFYKTAVRDRLADLRAKKYC